MSNELLEKIAERIVILNNYIKNNNLDANVKFSPIKNKLSFYRGTNLVTSEIILDEETLSNNYNYILGFLDAMYLSK